MSMRRTTTGVLRRDVDGFNWEAHQTVFPWQICAYCAEVAFFLLPIHPVAFSSRSLHLVSSFPKK